MSFTLTTLSGAIFKAGVNVNTDLAVSGTNMDFLADNAEDTFCLDTRKDWVTDYANIPTHLLGAISDAVSSAIAIQLINADSSGYLKGEAQTMLDVLDDNYNRIVKKINEDKNKVFN